MQEQAVGSQARAKITLEISHKTRADMTVGKIEKILGLYGSGLLICLFQLHGIGDALHLNTECYCLCLLNYPIYM